MITNACRFTFVCVIACAVAACGLQKGPHADHRRPGGAAHGSGSLRRGPAPCALARFTVRLDNGSAGVSAGTRYLPLDLTNKGHASCRLAGFPVVTLADGRRGRQVGRTADPDHDAAVRSMTLPAGRTAHFWVRLADVANLPAARCRPVQAAGLRVSLPGQAWVTFVPHPLETCARKADVPDVLTVEPFRPGLARPGTAR